MIAHRKPTRILMIADVFPPGICGIGDYTACLTRSLAAQGHEVTVLTKEVDGCPQRETVDGVRVLRVARGWELRDAARVLRVLDHLGKDTVVHIQYSSFTGYHRRLTINLLPALLRTIRRRSPVVITMHGWHENRMRWRLRASPMLLAHNCMVFVHACDQRMVTEWLRPPLFNSRLVPIASNIPRVDLTSEDRRRVRAELGFADDDRVIVFFGKVREDKGVDQLLPIIGELREQGIPAKLLVIGAIVTPDVPLTDYQRRLLAQIESAGGEDCIKVVDSPESEQTAGLLAASDLGVFPFTRGASENRGSLLAALINRLPVLTTRGESTPEGFEDRYGVETVPANDAAALKSRLQSMLTNPREIEALVRRSQNTAACVSWDDVADQMNEIYQECLRR